MATRLELQSKLEDMLGSKEVYYQAPPSMGMKYPAIVYNIKSIDSEYSNDKKYRKKPSYEIIVIDKKPDNPVIQYLLELDYCSYDRYYKSDNLHHDVLTLYW